MGMQSASIQQSPNQGSGKGMGPATGFPAPQGDYQNNTFDRPQPMPARLNMADQLLSGPYNPNPYQNGPLNSSEFNQGASSLVNVVPQGGGGYGDGTYGPPLNQQPMGGQNGQPDSSLAAPAVMPSRQQPMGKGGRNITMPGQGGQPRMGMPNAYSNTIQPWDNANIKPQSQSGKGKG
jgi:hypothetical protein